VALFSVFAVAKLENNPESPIMSINKKPARASLSDVKLVIIIFTFLILT